MIEADNGGQVELIASYFIGTDAVTGPDGFTYVVAYETAPATGEGDQQSAALDEISRIAVENDAGVQLFASAAAAKPLVTLTLGDAAEIAKTGQRSPLASDAIAGIQAPGAMRLASPPANVLPASAAHALSRYLQRTYGFTGVKLGMMSGVSSYRGAMLNITPAHVKDPATFRDLLARAKWFLPRNFELVYSPYFMTNDHFERIALLDDLT